ncbi:hypothetical protein [Streptomyces sp. PU-14G]|uniref:hypothetical protein n=1 Tax=Streptomyces sp. PU-14G TaxID=2800808 RepID=UPI0034DEE778
MKSWRTRIAAGLAVGAAALTLPLTATAATAADQAHSSAGGSASTSDWGDPADPVAGKWVILGGGLYDSYESCMEYNKPEFYSGITEVQCVHDPSEKFPNNYTIYGR